MQKKLAQIASIPNIIQSTLDTVSKTFENFLLSDYADDDDNLSEPKMSLKYKIDEDCSSVQETISQLSDADESVSYLDDFSIQSDADYNLNEERQFSEPEDHLRDSSIEVIVDEEEIILTPEPIEPTEEELIKMEKQNKIRVMEDSWPWGDKQKTIYKRSNCHLVPSSTGLIQERIKKLNYCEKLILRPKSEIHQID